MSYQLHEQYIDLASGFHIVVLRDGKAEHIAQIAIGADACPACGHLTPKDNLDQLDPKALLAEVSEALNRSHEGMLAYAKKHGLQVK